MSRMSTTTESSNWTSTGKSWHPGERRTQGNGPGHLSLPNGIAFDRSGNLWIADEGNNRIQEWTADGHPLNSWGGPDKSAALGQFGLPTDVAFDSRGNLYVADSWNGRI